MIKCIHNECQWPECDKTCGLVPTGDYAVGSSLEEGLIYHLQGRIADLLAEREETRALVFEVNRVAKLAARECSWDYDEVKACVKVCKHGYADCVNNPEYMRRYHTECWIEDGMPTECEECYYDDEDK